MSHTFKHGLLDPTSHDTNSAGSGYLHVGTDGSMALDPGTPTEITDNLTSTSTTAALSANMGRVLGLLTPFVGCILPYGGTTPPPGALMCDGSWHEKATYPALYAVIGDQYDWEGIGSSRPTQFRVPDSQGKFLEGKPSGGALGAEVAPGLPNITGELGTDVNNANGNGLVYDISGAFYRHWSTGDTYIAAFVNPYQRSGLNRVSFSAASSSSIYGNSTTVQPPAFLVNYIIIAGA